MMTMMTTMRRTVLLVLWYGSYKGTFLIRDKQDEPDCYALAVVSGTGKYNTVATPGR